MADLIEKNVTKIVVFEPWNLGDLVIACEGIRRKTFREFSFHLICNPKWVAWAQHQNYITSIYSFEAPWTTKQNKYKINKYKYKKIKSLICHLNIINPDLIWDPRGDVRHKLFLKIICKYNVLSCYYPSNINVYQRINYLSNYLNITNIASETVKTIQNKKNIVCFFSADWPNRRVPYLKACEIVQAISRLGFTCTIIIPPEADKNIYDEAFQKNKNIETCKTNLLEAISILQESACIISTDSAWLHLGYYYHIPVVGLYGFDTIQQWAPPNTNTVISEKVQPAKYRYRNKYINIKPLEHISVEKVIKAINLQK